MAASSSDDRYFAQRKAGVRPSGASAPVNAGGEEELVSFVEDGLNRRGGARPKPKLGANRPKPIKKKKKQANDLLSRSLIALGPTSSADAGLQRLCADVHLFTELLVTLGLSENLCSLAATSRSMATRTRSPDWRLLSVALAREHGMLSVELLPMHPAAPRTANGWKTCFAAMFRERKKKWGTTKAAEEESKDFKMSVMVRIRPPVRTGGAFSCVGGDGDGDDDEDGMFLPLHQRLQLERLGHDTNLESEVHRRMTRGGANGGRTFEEQKKARDRGVGVGGGNEDEGFSDTSSVEAVSHWSDEEDGLEGQQERERTEMVSGSSSNSSGVESSSVPSSSWGGSSGGGAPRGARFLRAEADRAAAEAAAAQKGLFQVGDRVEVRDSPNAPWAAGEVMIILPDGRPGVVRFGYSPGDGGGGAATEGGSSRSTSRGSASSRSSGSTGEKGSVTKQSRPFPFREVRPLVDVAEEADDSPAGGEEEPEDAQRRMPRAKIVNAEDKRMLFNLPGAGLRYFDFDAVVGPHSSAGSLAPPGDDEEGGGGGMNEPVAPNSQEGVYLRCVVPTLNAFFQGYSACLFAYGQTGSGKTHTIIGSEEALQHMLGYEDDEKSSFGEDNGSSREGTPATSKRDEQERLRLRRLRSMSRHNGRVVGGGATVLHQMAGVVPRVIFDTMGMLGMLAGSVDASVSCTYLEVYNDQLRCLLSGARVGLFRVGKGAMADYLRSQAAGNDGEGEGGGDGTTEDDLPYRLTGALELRVETAQEALAALAKGEAFKHKAATAMNERSSRAHTLFTLTLTQRHGGAVKRSRFSLVDLGGSEQVKKSKAEGSRLTEAIEINKSLMVLGQVIDALVQKKSHIPYYGSKLTTLLAPALGGNARTAVLVAASPDKADCDETLHALRFGERCRLVTNRAGAAAAVTMTEVLTALDAAVADAEARLAVLEARGAREKAEADLEQQAAGQGMADDMKVQAGEGRADYSVVDDDAGRWLAEKERIKGLKRRKEEITGNYTRTGNGK